jgi:hypothetical protein
MGQAGAGVYYLGMSLRFDPGVMGLFARLRHAYPDPEARAQEEARAEAALAKQRGKAAYAGSPTAARHAGAVLKPILSDGGTGLSELKRRWPEIVGESLAKASAPEKLSSGVLTVRAPGAMAPFIQHQAKLILDRCALAGAKATKLSIVQGAPAKAAKPVKRAEVRALTAEEEAALAADLARLPDGRLRQAVARLGRAVRRG